MSRNVYKTAQGQSIDIDRLRLTNEDTIAVGNMRVNARGDQVASDGTVVKPKNQIMKDRYRLTTSTVPNDHAQAAAVFQQANKEETAPATATPSAKTTPQVKVDLTGLDSNS